MIGRFAMEPLGKPVAVAAVALWLMAPGMGHAAESMTLVSAGYANVGEDKGGSFSLGVKRTWRWIAASVAGDVHLVAEDDPRYREEIFSNGQTVCRDTTNGQFADSEKCNGVRAEFGGSIDLAIRLGPGDANLEIGVGHRFAHMSTNYGLVRLKAKSGVFGEVRSGEDYELLQIGYLF